MNAKERAEWVKATAACLPGSDARAMLAACEALDGPGRWEASVSADLHRVGLRFFDAGGRFKAAAKAFGLEAHGLDASVEGFPSVAAAWDLRTGRWTSVRLCGAAKGAGVKPGRALAWDHRPGSAPVRRALSPVPFKAGVFKEPALDRALEEFARLSPLASMSLEGDGWSLRLARRLSWPLFARCDLSAAFTPSSSQRALLLLDRGVTELSFDGEALWAHCGG